jgi:signal transduction histidine kinase
MVGAYVLAIVVATRSVFAIEDAQRAAAVDQLETALQDAVAAWQDELLVELTDWMDLTTADPERAISRQVQMRRRAPWFNSLYLWEQPRRMTVGREMVEIEARVIFPSPAVKDDLPALARICIQRARLLATDRKTTPAVVAHRYISGCRGQGAVVRIVAATEAADLLKNHGMYDEAMDAHRAAGVPDTLTLAAGAHEGIPPLRLALFRLADAELLALTGKTDKSMDLLEQIAFEIAALDAPETQPLLQYIRWPVLAQLRKGKRPDAVTRVSAALGRATRRVQAFHELEEHILSQVPTPQVSEAPRFIKDQYSNTPYLIFFGWTNDLGVALQLEQDRLVSDFLSSKSVNRLRRWLVVTDEAGTLVGGPRRGGEVALQTRFTRTLSHLNAGLRKGAIDARMERVKGQWIAQLAVVFASALLGLAAMVVQIRASRQQALLIRRQREFTTRVTHELKTPLAGIRVTAENVEAGAFRDPRQLSEMAQRIVNETDRLTERVNEVLAAAQQRSIPNPKPFDPEEPLLEAIDTWGPRLEAAGVKLTADLDPTDEVLGDAHAIRDAVSCLLDNALKYRHEDREDSRVWLEMSQVAKQVEISVIDNGMGVPSHLRNTIFERFVRVEGPNRGKAGGYGLGLAQVADIATVHHGTVRCEEGQDGGARFVLVLPTVEGL